MPPSIQSSSALNDLLACNDEQFIHAAYQAILGRTPDSEGYKYYLDRVCSGVAKMQILTQLKLSSEGKALNRGLPGLNAAIKQYRRTQWHFIGKFFRNTVNEDKLIAISGRDDAPQVANDRPSIMSGVSIAPELNVSDLFAEIEKQVLASSEAAVLAIC